MDTCDDKKVFECVSGHVFRFQGVVRCCMEMLICLQGFETCLMDTCVFLR